MPQPINFIIDGGILLDISIGLGDIGLWLVIVIITDKIMDSIIWKKLAKLTAQLGCQRLVVGNHQGRLLHPGNHLGQGKCLACTGGSQQSLLPHT